MSRRLPSFTDLTERQEIVEYLGMLALNCSQTSDEYLNSFEYAGEMVRVKNVLIVNAKGFFGAEDLQEIFEATM